MFLINHMQSYVLHGVITYKILFPYKPMFPVDHKIFDNTCFVHNVCRHMSSLVILVFKKIIDVIILVLINILSRLVIRFRTPSAPLTYFMEDILFVSSSFHTSGEDLLVYSIHLLHLSRVLFLLSFS